MILTSRDRARRWMSIVAVGSLQRKGVRARCWNSNWLKAANILHDKSRDEFSGNWLAYISSNGNKDASTAALHLERCLGLVNLVGPSLRDIAALEAAFHSNTGLGCQQFAKGCLGAFNLAG